MMRRLLPLILVFLAATAAAVAPDRLATLTTRGARAFDAAEWASATALYEMAIDLRPDSAGLYAMVVASDVMAGDTVSAADAMTRAMSHGIGFAPLLGRVRSTLFSIGAGDRYGALLPVLRNEMPWMSRAIDHELLEHFIFRCDGPMMVKYARIMLAGLPDSPEYLSILARGYALQDDFSAAEGVWREMLRLDPDNYEALLSLGNCLDMKGDPEGRMLLRRAYEIRPTPYVATLISPAK